MCCRSRSPRSSGELPGRCGTCFEAALPKCCRLHIRGWMAVASRNTTVQRRVRKPTSCQSMVLAVACQLVFVVDVHHVEEQDQVRKVVWNLERGLSLAV